MRKKQIVIVGLGNTLEWLDFGLFIYLAPIIGQKFFPLVSQTVNTLSALSVFAIGFICRPLGGILFGHIGDIKGRAKTLRGSILMISLSTLMVGVLPTYESIGIWATIIFIFLRMAQGISVGGEYSGVMIYLAETAPTKKRGLVTSFSAIGANIGFLLATLFLFLLNNLFSNSTLHHSAWRLPFLFAGGIGSLIFFLRFKLKETPTFSYLKSTHHLETQPLLTALRYAPLSLIKILGLTCMGSSLYYVFFGFMADYLSLYLNVNANDALLIQSIFLAFMLFLVPIAGMLGDQFGRKWMLIVTAGTLLLLAIPCFQLLQSKNSLYIFLAFTIATFLTSTEQGNTLCAIVENCPANIRYSGIAFAFNLGNAIFGGTAPFILTILTEKLGFTAPAFYLMMMALITLITATTLLTKANINRFLVHPE